MPWGDIVDVLEAEFGRIIEVRVPSIKVRRRSGDESWFDELNRTAPGMLLTVLRLVIACPALHFYL